VTAQNKIDGLYVNRRASIPAPVDYITVFDVTAIGSMVVIGMQMIYLPSYNDEAHDEDS